MKKIYYTYLLPVLFISNLALAGGGEPTPLPAPGTPAGLAANRSTASLDQIQSRATSGFQGFFEAARWVGLLLGIVVVMKSLKNIADITAGKRDGSIAMNFFGIIIGGALTITSVILFMAANTAERLATGQAI